MLEVLAAIGLAVFLYVGGLASEESPAEVIVGFLDDDRRALNSSDATSPPVATPVAGAKPTASSTPVAIATPTAIPTPIATATPTQRLIIPAFRRTAEGWVLNKPLRVDTEWAMVMDGKILGKVKGAFQPRKTPCLYGSGCLLAVGKKLPETKKSDVYSGELSPKVTQRPIVVITSYDGKPIPFATNPDKWRTETPAADWVGRFNQAFREKFASTKNCAQAGEGPEKAVLAEYTDHDISVRRSLVSQRGQRMVEMLLKNYRCKDVPADGPYSAQLFHFKNGLDWVWLGNGMSFLEAGDYDGDGQSELIYFMSRGGKDGFVMYYNSVSKFIRLAWAYPDE